MTAVSGLAQLNLPDPDGDLVVEHVDRARAALVDGGI